jgi:putative membrane protein
MMWYGDGTTWWGWLLMSLMMIAFWGGVIWLVWYVVTRAGSTGRPASSPETILDERFARGEIDAEEYRVRRDALHGAFGRGSGHSGDER